MQGQCISVSFLLSREPSIILNTNQAINTLLDHVNQTPMMTVIVLNVLDASMQEDINLTMSSLREFVPNLFLQFQ